MALSKKDIEHELGPDFTVQTPRRMSRDKWEDEIHAMKKLCELTRQGFHLVAWETIDAETVRLWFATKKS